VVNQTSKEIGFFVQKKSGSDLPKNKISSPAVSKKKNRKGGLSMFLSGALDEVPKDAAPPPPTPRSEGPAWGGAKVSKESASLRQIQDEQSKTKLNIPTRNKDQVEDHFDSKSAGKVLLSSLMPSKPIPLVSVPASQASDAEINTPSWASGTPPLLSRPSLRDIQMQQVYNFIPCCVFPCFVIELLSFSVHDNLLYEHIVALRYKNVTRHIIIFLMMQANIL